MCTGVKPRTCVYYSNKLGICSCSSNSSSKSHSAIRVDKLPFTAAAHTFGFTISSMASWP